MDSRVVAEQAIYVIGLDSILPVGWEKRQNSNTVQGTLFSAIPILSKDGEEFVDSQYSQQYPIMTGLNKR